MREGEAHSVPRSSLIFVSLRVKELWPSNLLVALTVRNVVDGIRRVRRVARSTVGDDISLLVFDWHIIIWSVVTFVYFV